MGASKMAQQVEVLITKPDHLSLDYWIAHDGENWLSQISSKLHICHGKPFQRQTDRQKRKWVVHIHNPKSLESWDRRPISVHVFQTNPGNYKNVMSLTKQYSTGLEVFLSLALQAMLFQNEIGNLFLRILI